MYTILALDVDVSEFKRKQYIRAIELMQTWPGSSLVDVELVIYELVLSRH